MDHRARLDTALGEAEKPSRNENTKHSVDSADDKIPIAKSLGKGKIYAAATLRRVS